MKRKLFFAIVLVVAFFFCAITDIDVALAEETNTAMVKNTTCEDTVIQELTDEVYISDEYCQMETMYFDNTTIMRHDDKTRQYNRGIFSIDTKSVSDGVHVFSIWDYDWYNVEYTNGSVLVANIESNLQYQDDIFIAAIFIFPAGVRQLSAQEIFDIDIENTDTIQLLYVNLDETVCTKVISPLDEISFQQFFNKAAEWNLDKDSTDDISQNLIYSFSYEDNFKLRMYSSSESQSLTESQVSTMSASYGNYANRVCTVECNAYDSYTDTNAYIDDYLSVYRNNTYSTSAYFNYSDDPIVNIIPRQLFVNRNTYSFIGKEYGFFVKTVQDSGNNNLSSFIVFDIKTVSPYPERTNNNPFSVEVIPVFSGIVKYDAAMQCVTYDSYKDPNLALANIRVAVSVCNADEKNIGDSGYNAYQDYGYAISSYGVNAEGVGPKKDEDNAAVSLLGLTLGAIGLVPGGTPFGVASTIVGAIDFASNYINPDQRTQTGALSGSGTKYNRADYMIGNTNTNSMISNYGNLVKGFETKILNSNGAVESNKPLLYKNSNHYYKTSYGFCQKNSDINWNANIATYVSLDICQDNTRKVLFIEHGNIEFLDSVIGGRVDWYNERPSDTQGGNIEEGNAYYADFVKDIYASDDSHEDESYLPTTCSYRDFYFTPNRTFTYVIETFNLSPDTDPYLKLYDSQNKLIGSDDDSGGNGKAKLKITLTGGQIYKIRTMCHMYKSGAYDFIVRKHATLLGATRTDIRYTDTNFENDSVWLTYVPIYDDFYSFISVGSSDTCFTLYDSEYNRLAWDDDSGVGTNANIDFYLKGGKTYYLKANIYRMGSGQCNVYVNRQKELLYRPSQFDQFLYVAYSDSAQFFRFTPTVTRTYSLTTQLEVSGDPYLELYDSNWNRIAYNDDGGEGNNAQISYSLEAGKTYYFLVRGYSATLERGYVHF